MKIFKQSDVFDCGICVTRSLIDFFYKKQISRNELLTFANISYDGMSILDLEKLNKNYGINLDSYYVEFDDFVEHKTKDFFVLMLTYEYGNHYTIAKKNSDGVILYDSYLGRKKIKYEELKKHYCNIFIEIKKINTDPKLVKIFIEKNIKINYKTFFQVFLVNIALLGLTIIAGYFIKTIFDKVIASNDIANLGTIIFIAVLGYIAMNIGNFFTDFIESNQRKIYYKELSYELIHKLKNKNNNFLNKVSTHQFVMLDNHVDNIAQYYSSYYNSFYVNLFNSVFLLGWVLIIDWKIMVLILTSMFLQIIYTYFTYKFNKRIYPKMKFLVDNSKRNYFELEKFLQNEINLEKMQSLLQDIKNNVLIQSSLNYKWTLNNSYFEKINSFATNIINLGLYSLGAYMLLKNEIAFGNLIMATTFYNYINNFFSKLVSFYFYTVDFNFSKKTYLNFLNTSNNQEKGQMWESLQNIKIDNLHYYIKDKKIFSNLSLNIKKNCFIQGPSGSGKSTIYNLLCQKIFPGKGTIKFNGIEIKNFNMNDFNSNIIYQKNISYIPNFKWKTIFNSIDIKLKEIIIEIANLMDLEIKDNLKIEKISSGQAQFLNLLFLLKYKNKLIILDEATSHIDLKIKNVLYQTVIDEIGKKNFLICTEHDLNIGEFFEEKILLNMVRNEKSKI